METKPHSEARPQPSPGEAGRLNLLGLTRGQLAEVLAPHLDRPFRVDQIYRAMYERRVQRLSDITELSLRLREDLETHFSLDRPTVETLETSVDGTEKYLLRLSDGATIEAVDIPEDERRTLCISSQAGCALACRFCVTGYWGAGRDLTPGEIVSQVLTICERERPETHGLNLVFMGMGEPLLNLEAVETALGILCEQISWRRVTVSTAGLVPGIEAMTSWPRRPGLAISLHAPDDERRSRLMPINRKYPLAPLMAALRRYPLPPHQRITFEYILIQDFNDGPRDAELLAQLLRGLPAKVNLIPLNPDPVLGPEMRPPEDGVVADFRRRLLSLGVRTTTRKQRGHDISAACGQLRAPDRQPRGFSRQIKASLRPAPRPSRR